jgi:hypothetical protein
MSREDRKNDPVESHFILRFIRAIRVIRGQSSWILLGGLCLILPACKGEESKRLDLYPVEGKVLYAGKPAAGAQVWLHPVEKGELGDPRPHGMVQRDGSYALSTYAKDDGAPAGAYRPIVIWTKASKFRGDHEGESLLPPHYQDPLNSGLPVLVVKEGRTILPPLLLEP